MKKTKKLSILAVVALSACACMTAVACEEENEHTHEYTWAITTQPTAEAGGQITGTCAEDGETLVVDVPSLGDTAFWTVATTQPTHTEAGYTTYTSTEYKVTVRVDGASALGHTWGAWSVKTDSVPTQTAEGLAIRYCTASDGGEETATLKKLSDTTFWVVDTEASTAPTHTAAGATVYKNSTYNVTVSEPVPAEGHNWSSWSIKAGAEPTLAAGGKIVRTCLDADGGSQEVDVPALEIASFWTVGETHDPDCTNPGTRQYTNSQYSVSYTLDLPALDHEWSEWEWATAPALNTPGVLTRHCTRIGCDADAERRNVAELADTTVWDKDPNGIAANYNTAGFDVFTLKDGVVEGVEDEITFKVKTAEKTVAPYDNKNYVSFYFTYPEQVNRTLSRTNNWTYNYVKDGNDLPTSVKESLSNVMVLNPTVTGDTAAACFNNNWAPFRGHITIEMVDAAKGKVKLVCREAEFPSTSTGSEEGEGWGEGEGYSLGRAVTEPTIVPGGEVSEMYAYVDMTTGLLVVPSSDRILVFAPIDETDFTTAAALNKVDEIASAGSVWNGGAAVFVKTTAAGDNLNIFIKDNEVTFGVKFKDAPTAGADVAAADCYNADYVLITDSADVKIAAFGKNASGVLVETDGYEGVYTGAIKLFDANSQTLSEDVNITAALNGAGQGTVTSDNAAVNGATFRYSKAPAGSSYTLDLFVTDGVNDLIYYQITASAGGNTFTSVLPLITISYVTNNDGYTFPDAKWMAGIATDVPSIDAAEFLGWYDNAGLNGNPITEVKSFTNTTVYAKWSTAFVEFKLSGKNGETTATKYFTDGDTLGSILPELTDEQKVNPADNTGFVGWFVEVDGVETSADAETVLSAADAGAVIYGKWAPLGIWSFEMDKSYGWTYDDATGYWKSNNKGVNSSTAYMKIFAQDGDITVSFKAWASSEGGNYDYAKIWHYWQEDGSEKNDGGTKIGGKTLTVNDALDFKFTLHAGDYVKIDFVKDSSGDGGEDYGYLADLVINGRPVTVPNSPDFKEGTYNTSDGTGDALVLDGYGSFTWGEKSGTYKVAEGQSYYDMYVVSGGKATEYYELTLTGGNYSVNKAMVDITYSAGGLTVPEVVTVNKNIAYTLADGVVNAGYTFRGWFTQDGTSDEWGEKILTVTPNADTVVYGRYDAQVTITWNFLVNGVENATDTTKFVTDSVETVQAIDGVTNGDYAFVGWYTQDGSASGEWGDEVTRNTVLTGETVTFYAKWVTPHALMGSFKGANLDPSESKIDKEEDTSWPQSLTIDAMGSATGWKSGVIEEYDADTGKFTLNANGSKFNGGSNAIGGYLYIDWSTGKTTPYHDIMFMVKTVDSVTVTKTINTAWDQGCTKFIEIKYSDDSVKYCLIYNRVVYNVTTWTAKKADDTAITDVADLAANVDYLEINVGSETFVFVNSGTNLAEAGAERGTYKCTGSDDLNLNGAGNFTWGAKSGSYVAVDGAENTYKLLVKDSGKTSESYTVVIDMTDPANRTYTATENKVTVSFETAHGTQENQSVWTDIEYTLPTGLTEAGYIFRGWYNNDGTASGEWGSKVETVTPELGETYTYYAKWDAAATVTWNFLVNGVENAQDTDKFVGDAVGTVKAIGEVTNNDLLFFGWFTQDGSTSGEWGEQVTADTVLSGEAVTFYAKWGEAHALMGTYNGVEFDSTALRGTSSAQLVIDALGNVTGKKTGALTEVGDGVYKIGDYYMYYDAVGKAIVTNYGTSTDQELGTDLYVYILVPNADVEVGCSYSSQNTERYAVWDSNKTKLGKVTVGGVETLFFVYNNKVYGDVTVLVNDVETADMSKIKTKGNVVTIKDANGTQVYKAAYDGSAFVFSDGLGGNYTGDYGAIDVDGYGNLTISDNKVAYTVVEGRKITFVYGSRMYVVTLGDGAYTKELDGYQGTYTLPDGAGSVTLDGYGVADIDNTYYIVNDSTLTIFNPTEGTSVSYGITKGSFELLGKSVFAGMTFSGSVNTDWDTGNPMSIIFDDAPTLTGKITLAGEELGFTAEITDSTIVFTITTTKFSNDQVGKTYTFTISDSKLTYVSRTVSKNTLSITGTPSLNKQA